MKIQTKLFLSLAILTGTTVFMGSEAMMTVDSARQEIAYKIQEIQHTLNWLKIFRPDAPEDMMTLKERINDAFMAFKTIKALVAQEKFKSLDKETHDKRLELFQQIQKDHIAKMVIPMLRPKMVPADI